MIAWADRALAERHWTDAARLDDATLLELLEVATEQCAAFAGYVPPAPVVTTAPAPALVPLVSQLEAGLTTGVQVIGDSTGNDPNEWVYRLAQKVAADYPSYTVQTRLWADASQQYAAPVTIQTGPAGLQRLDGVANAGQNTLLAPGKHPASGNLDVRVKLAAASWTTNPALCNLASRSGVAGAYSHWLNYTTGKTLQFVYTVDGTTLRTATSTAPVPFTGSQVGWVRVVAIANNGTTAEFRFYTSTDGTTWTQLGTTVTATSYVLFDGGYSFEFGGRGTLNFPGSIYETEYRDGEDGPLMAPALPSLYGPNPLSVVDAPVLGSPVLTFVNGSHPGANIAYLGNATRLPKMLPNYGQAVAFTSDSHNEAALYGLGWLTTYKAWQAQIAQLLPVPLIPLTQNPENGAAYASYHAQRRLSLLGLDNVIDTYGAFLNYGDWAGSLMFDSVHPNSTGSDLWRDTVYAQLGVATTAEPAVDVPTRYRLAVVYQAREVYAAASRDGDVIGVGDYAIRSRPLTGAGKQLLRPAGYSLFVGTES
jgi:hypothetical protein